MPAYTITRACRASRGGVAPLHGVVDLHHAQRAAAAAARATRCPASARGRSPGRCRSAASAPRSPRRTAPRRRSITARQRSCQRGQAVGQNPDRVRGEEDQRGQSERAARCAAPSGASRLSSSIGPACARPPVPQPRRHAANGRSHMLPRMTSEPEQQIGVGTPDAFQRLWTPHRMAYIQGENKPTGPGADDGCPFCSIPAKSDEDGLVLARGRARLRRAQPVPVQRRPPDGRPLPARRRLHRPDGAGDRRAGRAHQARDDRAAHGVRARTASTSA